MTVKKFCPYCAGPLKNRIAEGRMRAVCSLCGKILYENPLPACCAVVLNERDEILLV